MQWRVEARSQCYHGTHREREDKVLQDTCTSCLGADSTGAHLGNFFQGSRVQKGETHPLKLFLSWGGGGGGRQKLPGGSDPC